MKPCYVIEGIMVDPSYKENGGLISGESVCVCVCECDGERERERREK